MADKKIALTKEGKEKLENELEGLKKVKRPAVIDRIKKAKDFGDLSENAEYEDARNEQSFIEGRIQEVEYMLKYSTVVDTKGCHGSVCLGCKVSLDIEGDKVDYELVSSAEADPASGKISGQSPIGLSLIGKKVGDKVSAKTPGGEIKIKVLKVL